ncbi:MAG: ScyD/ScyE family protein [Thermomicrobiales bacterium]
MNHRRRLTLAVVGTLALILFGPLFAAAQDATPDASQGGVTVVASGLTNPRGFVWDEDGTMYLALAGTGLDTSAMPAGTGSPAAESEDAGAGTGSPVVEGVGEGGTTASLTAGVITIVDGCAMPVVEGWPSGGLPELGWVLGVSDLAFLDGQLYALVDLHGAGPVASHEEEVPNGVYRVEDDGTMTLAADISAWIQANPVAEPHEPLSPYGEPFAMIAGDGMLWIAEANHQQVLTVTPDGTIARVADLSVLGNAAPDALAPAPGGGVYVGLLTALPFTDGTAKVIEVAPDGTVSDIWTGLTAVTSIAVADDGTLYALEMATGNSPDPPFYAPGTGKVVRQTGLDSAEEVVSGLTFPVKMKFGPDGGLYVGSPAVGANSGEGMIVRIDVSSANVIAMADQAATEDSCTS